MARDITVTLKDGSTHLYKGAPDNITPEAVTQRAQKEFGQEVTALDGGRGAANQPPKYDLKKWAGLTARNTIQGAAALPATLLMNPASALYNAGADIIQGKGKGTRLRDANANIRDTLTSLGFPTADTPGERVGSAMQMGIVGAMTGVGAGGLLRGPTAGRVGDVLTANPGKQVAGGLLGGGAAAQAGEMGLPLPVQIGAGFLGGVTPFAAPSIGGSLARAANSGLDRISRGQIRVTNPATVAEKHLRDAFMVDGGPEAAARTAWSYNRSGASTPSLLDIGGGNVRNLVRASAGEGGEAHNLAQNYGNQVRSNLQDNAVAAVNRMAPNRMSAAQTQNALEAGQREIADIRYPGPYREPAVVTPQSISALEGRTGQRMIGSAAETAEIRRDHAQMGQLQDLATVAEAQSGGQNPITGRFQSLAQALEGLSAGALDRVRIAFREAGLAARLEGRNADAEGYFARMRDIDAALDQTLGLAPARAEFRQAQQGIDAVEQGSRVIRTPSTQYAEETAALAGVGGPPNIGTGLRAGARESLINEIESPAAGQTGFLNRVATSNRADANLSNTFGAGRAETFREAITNEVQRLRNANYVSPETGSQTALREGQRDLLSGTPTTLVDLAKKIAQKIFGKIPLTDAERAEIVRLGISPADLLRFATPRTAARPTVSASQSVIYSGDQRQ